MIGLKPRLRARSSLFDLIGEYKSHKSNRQQPPEDLFLEEGIDDLPPLPYSPSPTFSYSAYPTPIAEHITSHPMAPVSPRNMPLCVDTAPADLALSLVKDGEDSSRGWRRAIW